MVSRSSGVTVRAASSSCCMDGLPREAATSRLTFWSKNAGFPFVGFLKLVKPNCNLYQFETYYIITVTIIEMLSFLC